MSGPRRRRRIVDDCGGLYRELTARTERLVARNPAQAARILGLPPVYGSAPATHAISVDLRTGQREVTALPAQPPRAVAMNPFEAPEQALRIVRAVARAWKVAAEDLFARRRAVRTDAARMALYLLLWRRLDWSAGQVARCVGRDRSTVSQRLPSAVERERSDVLFRERLAAAERLLEQERRHES